MAAGRSGWTPPFFSSAGIPTVYLDISGIPPKALLNYFPRLDEIAHKTLFGTDWPSPGVPEVGWNLEEFKALPISEEMSEQILSKTAASLWPE